MNFELTSDQKLMIEAVQHAVERDIKPLLDGVPADRPLTKSVAQEIMQHGANLGLTAARVPEAFGGSGLTALDYGLMCEQLPTAALFVIMPQETTVTRICFGSSAEQKERFLPDLIAAKLSLIHISEPTRQAEI